MNNKNIKVGDKVVVCGYVNLPAIIYNIYWEDFNGKVTSDSSKISRIMLELDWGEHGKSRVALHDENKIWYRYSEAN